jgi:hypothetical protein
LKPTGSKTALDDGHLMFDSTVERVDCGMVAYKNEEIT